MKQLRKHADLLPRIALIGGMVAALSLCSGASLARAESVASGSEAPSREAATAPVVEYSAGLLSVTAKDADVRAVVDAIGARSGIEIVLDNAITGKVTVDFKGMKFDEALKAVLRDLIEGGFVSEYVRKPGSKDAFDLQKVVIAPRTGLPQSQLLKNVEDKDVLRIDEMYVGEAKGEEVLFVPWGEGEGQIPLMVVAVDGKEERLGFDRFRVGEDGSFYFVGWGHKKLWVYGRDGQPLKAIDLTLARFGGDTFDVDHEGNVYVLTKDGRKNDAILHDIRVYSRDAKEVARVSASAGRAGAGDCVAAVDGLLVQQCESGRVVADFRHLLRDPTSRSRKFKNFLYSTRGSFGVPNPLGPPMPGIAQYAVENVRKLGIPQNVITAPIPQEWAYRVSPLAYQAPIFFELLRIPTNRRAHDEYAIAAFDLAKKRASYYRLAEKDSFIYETDILPPGSPHFDTDLEGNVYQLFTGKDGVHIYRYRLEDVE